MRFTPHQPKLPLEGATLRRECAAIEAKHGGFFHVWHDDGGWFYATHDYPDGTAVTLDCHGIEHLDTVITEWEARLRLLPRDPESR